MHDDQFNRTMLELVKAADIINEMPIPEFIEELGKRQNKFKAPSTPEARYGQKSTDSLLGLMRILSQVQSKIKRPLRTLFRTAPGLKHQLYTERAPEPPPGTTIKEAVVAHDPTLLTLNNNEEH